MKNNTVAEKKAQDDAKIKKNKLICIKIINWDPTVELNLEY